MMSEEGIIFFIISFGLLFILCLLFIIFIIRLSGRITREEEDERVDEIFRKRNTK